MNKQRQKSVAKAIVTLGKATAMTLGFGGPKAEVSRRRYSSW